jgi:amino acid adenylation domain-containing protein
MTPAITSSDADCAGRESSPQSPGDSSAPLSFAQQRLWFLDQLYPNNPTYNLPLGLHITGPLHLAALQSALQQLIDRHEILRTQFRSPREVPAQEIQAGAQLPVILRDLPSRETSVASDEFQRLVKAEARRPFDLSSDLMIRAGLWSFSPEEHFLLLTLHHIAADEWSLQVLIRELIAFYEAGISSKQADLRDLPIQYADFALWQRDLMQQGFFRGQLDYWKKQLENLPRLELPADMVRAEMAERPGHRATLAVPRSLGEALVRLAQQHQATPFMLFLAAFKVLLCRLTNQEDLAVGSPIAGRTRIETEDLIGFFVNTLVFRLDASGNPTFAECLRRVRAITLQAFAHQELPFDQLVEELQPERTFGQVPLVQVMFALEGSGLGQFSAAGASFSPAEVHTDTAKFDLTFVIREAPEGFCVVAEFDSGLFAPETIQRWLGHYATLLEGISANPDSPIWKLPLLTAAEIQEVTQHWNATQTPYPSAASLAEIFEEQVRRAPEKMALAFGGSRLSYGQLNEQANRLSDLLLQRGVEPGSFVAVFLERSAELIVSILAITKTGAAYLPLDTNSPKERLEYMLADANARLLITSSELLAKLPGSPAESVGAKLGANCPRVVLDEEAAAIGCCSEANPVHPGLGDRLAYLMYTSGSTGRPKGVIVPQRAIARLVLNSNYVDLKPEDRVAQASTATFDAATFEIWGALLNGATLVGIAKETAISPGDLARTLRSERISILFLTTALFNQIASDRPKAFSGLRYLLFGGEAVDPKWVRTILKEGPPEQLLHVYGPTETTTFAAFHVVEEVPAQARTIPIGRPISNTEIFILDRYLQPVPAGVTGELYIGGPGVARGYLNEPELTAQKFLPHPLRPGTVERVYKTGDLGRFLPEGRIEFVGRADNQVKIRGFRIELGEVESVLAAHPTVAEATVLAIEQTKGEKKLVAYWVPKTKDAPPPSYPEFRQFLQQRLPEYMIPTAFIPLPAFPLTPNGKINRQALPAPDWTRPDADRAYRAPQGLVELELTRLWEKVLGIQNISRHDHFFDLGGHSLLAIRLFSEIEQTFRQHLPLSTLFRAPTIASLAECLSQARWQPASSDSLLVEIQPAGSRPPIFWVHSLGGDGGGGFFYYRKLAELLGPDQPSYGIRSPVEPFHSIEEMAGRYIEEIRKLQPRGPYYVGGFCFGGVVAFEIARQLAGKNCPVGALVLLESVPPNCRVPLARWNWGTGIEIVHNLFSWLQDLPFRQPSQLVARLDRKRKTLQKKLAAKFRRSDSGRPDVQLKDVINLADYPKDYVVYAEAHWQALRAYQPKDYTGHLTLFRAKKQPLSNLDPALGWSLFAKGGVDLHVIPGGHEALLQEPNVRVVAEQLQARLVAIKE